jgi:hypothetical protein
VFSGWAKDLARQAAPFLRVHPADCSEFDSFLSFCHFPLPNPEQDCSQWKRNGQYPGSILTRRHETSTQDLKINGVNAPSTSGPVKGKLSITEEDEHCPQPFFSPYSRTETDYESEYNEGREKKD